MKNTNEDELQFVARHYEENALNADSAWQRFRLKTGQATHRLSAPVHRLSASTRRIAASVSIALIVGGSVACGFWYHRQQAALLDAPAASETAATTSYRYLQPSEESIILKYNDAPIEEVLCELSSYYGRTIVLQSASASGRHISGEIEATSLEEVVEILEATLDVEIEIQDEN